MRYGLSESTIERICLVFRQYDAVEEAVLYGSRALGTYKTGSDIDLALKGENLDQDTLASLTSDLDDLLLPYSIDLSILEGIVSTELKEHIDRAGIPFYIRTRALRV
jgi:predicted nucleotidyltransferase